MKETYFSPRSLKPKSVHMLKEAMAYSQGRNLPYMPERSALLVLDMQRYFLEPTSHAFVPSAPAILSGIKGLVSAYKKRSLPIIFTRHLNTAQDAGAMTVWWRDLITVDKIASQISGELDLSTGEVLTKSQYDAFYNTSLEDTLRSKGVSQLLICGVMTHLCCETTARSGFVRGFDIFFTVDGTATYNETLHRATLTTLAHGFAVPVLIDQLLALLEAKDGT